MEIFSNRDGGRKTTKFISNYCYNIVVNGNVYELFVSLTLDMFHVNMLDVSLLLVDLVSR